MMEIPQKIEKLFRLSHCSLANGRHLSFFVSTDKSWQNLKWGCLFDGHQWGLPGTGIVTRHLTTVDSNYKDKEERQRNESTDKYTKFLHHVWSSRRPYCDGFYIDEHSWVVEHGENWAIICIPAQRYLVWVHPAQWYISHSLANFPWHLWHCIWGADENLFGISHRHSLVRTGSLIWNFDNMEIQPIPTVDIPMSFLRSWVEVEGDTLSEYALDDDSPFLM